MKQEKYWNERAKKFGNTIQTVNNDFVAEELEYKAIFKLIKGKETILDLGCGNGFLISAIKKEFPKTKLYGVELTKSLTGMARERTKVMIIQSSSDNPKLLNLLPKFDLIITKRLLVNLTQKQIVDTVENIKMMLKPNGRYIMCECFAGPLKEVNKIRKQLNLHEIKVDKIHNRYLTKKDIDKISLLIGKPIHIYDFMSVYYLISRTLNAKIFGPIYNTSFNNAIKDCQGLKGFSPEVIYVFENKKEMKNESSR